MTDLPFTTTAAHFCRFITTDLAHLLFPRLFLWRPCVRKGLTNTDEKAAFSFVLFPTEAAVFEFRKKVDKQLVERNCCLFFFVAMR